MTWTFTNTSRTLYKLRMMRFGVGCLSGWKSSWRRKSVTANPGKHDCRFGCSRNRLTRSISVNSLYSLNINQTRLDSVEFLSKLKLMRIRYRRQCRITYSHSWCVHWFSARSGWRRCGPYCIYLLQCTSASRACAHYKCDVNGRQVQFSGFISDVALQLIITHWNIFSI